MRKYHQIDVYIYQCDNATICQIAAHAIIKNKIKYIR